MLETLMTHPSTATDAKAFTSPSSLSYPGGAGDLTPPMEKDAAAAAANEADGMHLVWF